MKDTPSQTPSQLSHRVQQFQHVSSSLVKLQQICHVRLEGWPCNAPCCRCCLHTILRPFSSTPLYFATNPARCEVCKSVQKCFDGRIWRLSLLLVQCIHAAQVTHRCCMTLLCARLPVEMPMNSLDALHACLCWLLNLSYYQLPAGIAPQGCKTMH